MKDRISIDTRTIQPGDIFIPVGDGINYCDEAIKKGAKVLNVDLTEYAIEKRSKYTGTVIGVTGSFGKTTLKDTLVAALSSEGVSATEKNFNNEIGVPLTIANADLESKFWIIEMGIRKSGDMIHLSNIVQPTIAVLSGFGYTHMEFYSSEIDLLKEKLNIITNATSHLFIPSNIHCKKDIYQLASSVKIIESHVESLLETNFSITKEISTFYNLDLKQVGDAMLNIKRSPHRLAEHVLSDGTIILDDSYNANPTAVKFAVEHCIKYFPNKRILLILGDMEELGQQSEILHKSIYDWVISQDDIDSFITYGKRFISSSQNYSDHSLLINYIIESLLDFDLILLKGSRSNKLDIVINEVINLTSK